MDDCIDCAFVKFKSYIAKHEMTLFLPSMNIAIVMDVESGQKYFPIRRKSSFLACRSRQASIVLERYFRFEVSLLSFYACERDGPI